MVISREIEGDRLVLTVEVDSQEFDREADLTFRKLSHSLKVRGFRPGKIPRKVFELYYGKSVLYKEAAKKLIERYLPEALDSVYDEIFGDVKVHVERAEEGQPFVFKISGWKRPSVQIDHYKGIEVGYNPDKWKVTDEMVENTVKGLREKYAEFIPIEKEDVTVTEGLFALIEYKIAVKDADKVYEEKEAMVGVSDDSVFFGKNLIGMKSGEEKSYTVRIPEDFSNKEIAGKEAECWVKVKQVLQKKLPEVDKDFVAVFGFESVDEFYNHVRQELQKDMERRKQEYKEDMLWKILRENVSIEIPEGAIDEESKKVREDEIANWNNMGIDRETYMKLYERHSEEMDRNHREKAKENLISRLFLDEIVKRESVEVTDEDYDREIRLLAKEFKKSPEDIRKFYDKDYLAKKRLLNGIKRKIGWERIVDAAVLIPKRETREESEGGNTNAGSDSDRT